MKLFTSSMSLLKQYKYTVTGVVITAVAQQTLGAIVSVPCALATGVAYTRENPRARAFTDRMLDKSIKHMQEMREKLAKQPVIIEAVL